MQQRVPKHMAVVLPLPSIHTVTHPFLERIWGKMTMETTIKLKKVKNTPYSDRAQTLKLVIEKVRKWFVDSLKVDGYIAYVDKTVLSLAAGKQTHILVLVHGACVAEVNVHKEAAMKMAPMFSCVGITCWKNWEKDPSEFFSVVWLSSWKIPFPRRWGGIITFIIASKWPVPVTYSPCVKQMRAYLSSCPH